jgi:hypothetical protein
LEEPVAVDWVAGSLLKFFAYQQIGRVKDAAALDAVRTSGFSKMQASDAPPADRRLQCQRHDATRKFTTR